MRPFPGAALVMIALLSAPSLAAVSVKISKNPSRQLIEKRQDSVPVPDEELFHNNTLLGGLYVATIEVGTPPQTLHLNVDTGSSDLWLLSTDTDMCADETLAAKVKGGCITPFSESASSSKVFVPSGRPFEISYGDKTGATGYYVNETVIVGDSTLRSVQMAVASKANISMGLMGIGYTSNQAEFYVPYPEGEGPDGELSHKESFPSILDQMVNQSAININAYSMYLDDVDSSTGSIIFGGLDTDKFQGNLVQLPIIPKTTDEGTTVYKSLKVVLNHFNISDSVAQESYNLANKSLPAPFFPVLIDSGTAFSYLPMGMYVNLAVFLNITSQGFVNCNWTTELGPGVTLDFGFSTSLTDQSSPPGAIIRVPISEFIIPYQKLGLTVPINAAGATDDSLCYLGFKGAVEEPYILGDTFMRSAYVVFDLKNNLMGMAQTNFNSTTSTIIDFAADQTEIPKVSGVAVTPPITALPTSTTSSTSAPSSTSTKKPNAGNKAVGVMDTTWIFVMSGSAIMSIVGSSVLL